MKCPQCSSPLREYFYHGSAIDVCIDCGGVWFDEQELKHFISGFLTNNPDIPEAKIDLNKKVITRTEIDSLNHPRVCPKCASRMQAFNFAYDSNIILDRCDICSGIWADGKETHQLAIHFKGNEDMRELGRAMLEESKQSEQFRQLAELGGSLSQSARVWMYLPKIILPLRDTIQRNIFPVATIGIIAINIVVFIYQLAYIQNHEFFFNWFGTVPSKLINDGTYFTLFTSMFLHADFWHLAGNMFFLWLFGDNIEESLGRVWFIIFYVLVGIFSDLAFVAMNSSLDIPVFGASGAIAGVMGAYLILFSHAKIKTLVIHQVIDIPVQIYLGAWLMMQIVWSVIGVPGVAWSAHIGGFVFGAFIGWLYKKTSLSSKIKVI